ncbi:MAG: hypothetical protein H5T62_16430 [Anaerolineae bacterium]|nr:hypothetical protein [Anaerolineae bacterium]
MHSLQRPGVLSLLMVILLASLGACIPATILPSPTDTPVPTECIESLDEETLERLRLSMETTVEMQPGETCQFALGVVECCYYFQKVAACATWSVNPAEGAHIDPDSGVLTIDDTTPSGSVFTVTADVEKGRRMVTIDVHVFTPEDNPLVGIWREEAQFACDTGEELTPEERIGELRFRADGSFSVTWVPFEVYRDYWGTYEYDLATGNLSLQVIEGNYVPDDIDGSGSFAFDEQGRLLLRDIWLGSPYESTGPAHCGHRFRR